ncbi:MAG TPA: methyltransferase domain-containing protein [bacterium]|nr:methyltransferase domain-containing protein [bacterium]
MKKGKPFFQWLPVVEKSQDREIDKILGFDRKAEGKVNFFSLARAFGSEQFIYEATPYDSIRQFIEVMDPKSHDIVYDLGAGYGRVVLFGALLSPAIFVGIEIVPERVRLAERIRRHLEIENAYFKVGNVLSHDFSDGTIFFLFNPFVQETLEAVGERLRKIAKRKQIKIATWGGSSNDYFSRQNWLSEVKPLLDSRLQYFTSI